MNIRLVGISGSPRHRSTEFLVQSALEAAKNKTSQLLKDSKIEIDLISLSGKHIEGCIDCRACETKGSLCIRKDDWVPLITRIIKPIPQGLIVGSPVYFFDVSSRLRAFMERCTCLFNKCWNQEFPIEPPDWSKTAAGAIAVGFHRHGGEEHTAAAILHWLLTSGFVVVGSTSLKEGPLGYIAGTAWSGIGNESKKVPVEADELGIRAVEVLGENVGACALRLALGESALKKDRGNELS